MLRRKTLTGPDWQERTRKAAIICALCYFVYLAYMLLHPIPPVPYVPYVFSVIHFLAFVVLGGLVGLARRRWSSIVWFFLLALWGIGSELLQNFTGRFCEWQDMVQNVLGIAAGLFIAWLLRYYLLNARKSDAHD